MDNAKERKELFLMQQIIATLFSVTNKVQKKGDSYLKTLTSRQIMMLITIIHLPGDETTFKNIAKSMGTSKQNISKIMSGLEVKGFIEIIPGKIDKREVNVNITELGKQSLLECNERSLKFFLDLFNEFSEEEMETLWKLLKKMYRFDGEKQDLYEDDTVLEVDEAADEIQNRAFMKFVKARRKK